MNSGPNLAAVVVATIFLALAVLGVIYVVGFILSATGVC